MPGFMRALHTYMKPSKSIPTSVPSYSPKPQCEPSLPLCAILKSIDNWHCPYQSSNARPGMIFGAPRLELVDLVPPSFTRCNHSPCFKARTEMKEALRKLSPMHVGMYLVVVVSGADINSTRYAPTRFRPAGQFLLKCPTKYHHRVF